jgi:hypothetical protein
MSGNDVLQQPSGSSARPRWRKRLILFSLSGLFIVALCLAVPFIYFVYSSDRELHEAIAEADRLDPGWRPRELEEKRAVIPDEQNSALVLLAAKGLIPLNWPLWSYPQAAPAADRPKLTDFRKELRYLKPPVQLDEDLTSALRQELQRAVDALAAVRKVVSLPKGRYPPVVSPSGMIGYATHARDTLKIAHLLAYDALVRAQDKDVDGALASCSGILNCGRSIGDEPAEWSMIFRVALNQMAARKVERTLGQGQPSEAALASIQTTSRKKRNSHYF